MPSIQITVSDKDAIIKAWSNAVADTASVSRAILVRAVIRSELLDKKFCIGRIHKNRLDAPSCSNKFVIPYSDDNDNDIAKWLVDMRQQGTSVSKLIKAYIIRHVEIIDDDRAEYFPDYQDCIEVNNTFNGYNSSLGLTSMNNDVNHQSDIINSNKIVSSSAEMIETKSYSDSNSRVSVSHNDEMPAKKKKSSFAGIGGASRK